MVDLAFSEGLGSTDLVFERSGHRRTFSSSGWQSPCRRRPSPGGSSPAHCRSPALPLCRRSSVPARLRWYRPSRSMPNWGLAVTLPAAIFAGRLRSGALPLSSAAALPAIVPFLPDCAGTTRPGRCRTGAGSHPAGGDLRRAAQVRRIARSPARPLCRQSSVPADFPGAGNGTPGPCDQRCELPEVAIAYDNAVNRAPFRWASDRWSRAAAQSADCHSPHLSTRSRQVAMISTIATATPRRSFSAPDGNPCRRVEGRQCACSGRGDPS
jgi:hypothetical protein